MGTLGLVFQSNRLATVAQIAEDINAGYIVLSGLGLQTRGKSYHTWLPGITISTTAGLSWQVYEGETAMNRIPPH